MREIPYSGRSENPFTRAAQDRDRALLPEPVQALLQELFEIRDKFAKDEAGLAEAIEKELTARDFDQKRLVAIGRSYGAELAEEDAALASRDLVGGEKARE